MSSVLDAILARKREEGESARAYETLPDVRRRAEKAPVPRGFERALRQARRRPATIAEFKRRSPSKGAIREDARPADVARAYEAAGAAAMSVLTDGAGFGGAPEHLVQARAAVALPVLRKDFLLDAYDLYASRALGADAALLIVAAIPDAGRLAELLAVGASVALEVLVEAHDEAELDVALAAGAHVIGVNARDLRTFVVDPGLPARLRPRVPADRVYVAESGISTPADVAALRAAGVDAMLVGESLMRAPDPGAALDALLASG